MRGRKEEKVEVEAPKTKGLKVTYYNMKTGMVEKTDPYILRFVGQDRAQLWERPAGSGNLWSQSYGGEPMGRWDARKPEGDRHLKDAEHVEWVKPLTEDQKLASTMAAQDIKIKALEAEIAAITAENKRKSAPKADKV